MKLFKSAQVREIDSYTIKNEPISSIDLMERASINFANWFCKKFDSAKKVVVFSGPGNNGGDGLAVARILSGRNFNVQVYLLDFGRGLSEDCQLNLNRLKLLKDVRLDILSESDSVPEISGEARIIDAIFGSGLSRPVKAFPKKIIQYINSQESTVISVDIPSGLFGEDNSTNDLESIVKADYTLSFEFPFLAFFFSDNNSVVGKWDTVSIGIHKDIVNATPSKYLYVEESFIKSLFRRRDEFSHKGSYGHALMIAASYGMMGAAVLATKACLRTGVGLVTAHLPRLGYEIMQTSVPEALISIDPSDKIFSDIASLEKYNAIGIGPGLTTNSITAKATLKLISDSKLPMILDADALNILSENKDSLTALAYDTIISPHPGEFDRLAGKSYSGYERHLKQVEMSMKYGLIIILKGKYTIISLPTGESFINPTGNSGLATGGSGDVLTGIITSLLAQNYTPTEASIFGVYLHGFAADLALDHQSQESLLPSDVIDNLGRAFKVLGEK